MDEAQLKKFRILLPEDNFPAKVTVLCGKTLVKTGKWWKAILLIKIPLKNGEKYQLRLYAWEKRDGVYKYRQKFNMSQSGYLSEIIKVISHFNTDKLLHVAYVSQKSTFEQIQKLQKDLEKEKQKRTRDSRKINKLTSLLGEKELEFSEAEIEITKLRLERQNLKERALASRIPEFKEKIIELKSYLKDKTKNENFYHKFLKENPWIFGSWYVNVRSKKSRKVQDVPDFELERYDGFHDLVELESPHDQLFKISSGRLKQSTELKNSLSEIMQYVDGYIQQHLLAYYEEQKEIFKPRGYIIIGRTNKTIERELHRLNTFLHGIEVWTFDDLIQRAERSIKFLEAKTKEEKVGGEKKNG